jgi:two-component system response regulator (stage 0 sporulation protein F)
MLSSSPNINGSSKSILIVDDDEIIREVLSHGFLRFDFKVFTAENATDAWIIFNSEHIDFVVTDIWMPGLNGMDLSRRIKIKSPFTKIALMTGGETEGVQELIDDGTVDHFFWKPFDIQNICKIFSNET